MASRAPVVGEVGLAADRAPRTDLQVQLSGRPRLADLDIRGQAVTQRDMIHLQNLRKRLRQAIKDQAEDIALLGLINEINETTDRLINEGKN
jgi:hypothetical protein